MTHDSDNSLAPPRPGIFFVIGLTALLSLLIWPKPSLFVAIAAAGALGHGQRTKEQPAPARRRRRARPAWSIETLQGISWQRFETLCAEYFRLLGFRVEVTAAGPDDGIDALIYRVDEAQPAMVMQCKAWSGFVGVKPVRELLGVMSAQNIPAGVFMTTGGYTRPATQFATANRIDALTGEELLTRIRALPRGLQDALMEHALHGSTPIPECPACALRMVERAHADTLYWGCRRFPVCRTTLPMESR